MATRKPQPVRQRTSTASAQTFDLFMERFDRVDKDNDEIKQSVASHLKDDAAVYATVGKHSTYWELLLKIAVVIFVASIGVFIDYLFVR